MIAALRFIGIVNAAVWFGGALFYTVGVLPAFFNSEMKRVFGDFYVQVIANELTDRYYSLFYWCGIVALVHQLTEWVYLGKPLQRLNLAIIMGVFCFALFGGLWLQPRLKDLHHARYVPRADRTETMRHQAHRSFRIWNGISRASNLLLLPALLVYTWRIVAPPNATRFLAATKFRS